MEDFDALLYWTLLTSVIEGEGIAKEGLASPKEVTSDVDACRQQSLLGSEASSQAQFLPTNISGIPYVGCQALALGRVAGASIGEEL